MFEIFSSADAWVALLTLTFLEIVLGIDNIVFISIELLITCIAALYDMLFPEFWEKVKSCIKSA